MVRFQQFVWKITGKRLPRLLDQQCWFTLIVIGVVSAACDLLLVQGVLILLLFFTSFAVTDVVMVVQVCCSASPHL